MKKAIKSLLAFGLATSMLTTAWGAQAATIKPSPAIYKKGTYFSTKKINWTTRNPSGSIDLAKVTISGTSGGSYLNKLKKSACVLTSMSMILRNMEVKTVNAYYDFRTGKTDQLAADPYIVSLLNMSPKIKGVKRDGNGLFAKLPQIQNNKITGYSGNNTIVYINSYAGADITKHFAVNSMKYQISGSAEAKKQKLIALAKQYPHGTLIRFQNSSKGQHSMVLHGYVDSNQNKKSDFDDLRFSDPANGEYAPFAKTYTGNKAYKVSDLYEYWSFTKKQKG
jgi:hypothetical protein